MLVHLNDPLDIRCRAVSVRTGADEIGAVVAGDVDIPAPILGVRFGCRVLGLHQFGPQPFENALSGDRIDRVRCLRRDIEFARAERNDVRRAPHVRLKADTTLRGPAKGGHYIYTVNT